MVKAVAYVWVRPHILSVLDPQRQHIAKILVLEYCETPNLHPPKYFSHAMQTAACLSGHKATCLALLEAIWEMQHG